MEPKNIQKFEQRQCGLHHNIMQMQITILCKILSNKIMQKSVIKIDNHSYERSNEKY